MIADVVSVQYFRVDEYIPLYLQMCSHVLSMYKYNLTLCLNGTCIYILYIYLRVLGYLFVFMHNLFIDVYV